MTTLEALTAILISAVVIYFGYPWNLRK